MTDEPQNKVVLKSGMQIAICSEWWELRDDGVAIDYVDVVTAARQFNGIIHLALGAGVRDANNLGIVHVTNRLRMNLAAAQALHNLLGTMISDALKPTDKSQAS